MFERRRSGSMLCPSCGQLVGVNDEQCLNCGRRNPGLWGFGPSLGAFVREVQLAPVVMWGCGMLYILSLAIDWNGMEGGGAGLLGVLSPSGRSLLKLGMSGGVPVFLYHHWWTLLSAGWLHGGILHIVFNMMAVRDLGPLVSQLYGTSRTTIIYTVASVFGFVASSSVFMYLPILGGAAQTMGASAAVSGLIGALLHYGRRGGSSLIATHARGWAIGVLIFGFVVPGVDNWAHLGGLAAGYLASMVLDPLRPERPSHAILAVACVLASAAAVAASVLTVR